MPYDIRYIPTIFIYTNIESASLTKTLTEISTELDLVFNNNELNYNIFTTKYTYCIIIK